MGGWFFFYSTALVWHSWFHGGVRIYGPQDASFELYVFLLIAVIGYSQYIERSMLAH